MPDTNLHERMPEWSAEINRGTQTGMVRCPARARTKVAIDAPIHSLAVRDLQRGHGVGLPSGESVARHIGVAPLTAEQVGSVSTGWRGETPLWYYILREADVCADGNRLGPVGGRIVAEVLVGLMNADMTAYRQYDKEWRPQKTLSELLAS
jgi:hypothetical protein